MTVRAKVLFVAGLAFLLVLMLVPYGPVSAAGAPYHVHLTWRQDPLTTITMTWHNDKGLSAYTPTVR